MATDVDDSIDVIVHLQEKSQDAFREIWHLENVRIAKTDAGYWLKGFTSQDLKSKEVRSISNLKIYEVNGNFLYLNGNRVPERKVPVGLLWHPIQQALKVDLPSFNENLFDVTGKLKIEFALSSDEQVMAASIVKVKELNMYVDSVPQHYFNDLSWCVLGKDQAVLLGSKILPMVSQRYWKYKNLLIPVGYDFKYGFLKEVVTNLQYKSNDNNFWVFDVSGTYFSLSKDLLVPMNRSSVKQTFLEC